MGASYVKVRDREAALEGMCMYAHELVSNVCVCMYACVCMYVCMYACVCMHACVYTHMN